MAATASPRDLIAEIEARPTAPEGSGERFSGYGVMGLPFRSGHLLAMRRFPVSSVGPGYQSVWHRDPAGRWTFFQDVPSAQGCARYFGAAGTEVPTAKIHVIWDGPSRFSVSVADAGRQLKWSIKLISSGVTRAMNALGAHLPEAVWRQPLFLAAMGTVAGPLLRAGKVQLAGRAPNGQRFVANPLRVWIVGESQATLDGLDLGAIGPSPTPGRLGDFWIPQRGVFAIGRASFEPAPLPAQRSVH
jgi:hypothetical protein